MSTNQDQNGEKSDKNKKSMFSSCLVSLLSNSAELAALKNENMELKMLIKIQGEILKMAREKICGLEPDATHWWR